MACSKHAAHMQAPPERTALLCNDPSMMMGGDRSRSAAAYQREPSLVSWPSAELHGLFGRRRKCAEGEGIVQGVWVLSEGSAFPTPSADRFRGWLSGFWAASICAEKNSGQKAAVRSAEGERRRGSVAGQPFSRGRLSRTMRKSFGKVLEMCGMLSRTGREIRSGKGKRPLKAAANHFFLKRSREKGSPNG